MNKFYPNFRFALNILLLTLIFVSVYMYAMFQGGFVSWFLFYSVLFVLLLEIVVIVFPYRLLTVTRKINKGLFKNREQVHVTITVKKKRYIPFFYLVVSDSIPERCNWEGQSKLFFFSLKEELTFSYELNRLPRGEYIFDHIEIKTGDLFGFFSKVKKFDVLDKIIVYPDYQDIESWQVVEGDEESQSITSIQDNGTDVTSLSGLRDYIQGDRLYSIHWKATARANKLVTKEFESYQEQAHMIVFDCSLPQKSQQASENFEKSIQFAASIVRYSLQSKVMLGFLSAGKTITKLPIQLGEEHQMTILGQLAKAEQSNQSTLVEAFDDLLETNSTGTTMVVISTQLSEEAIHVLKRAEVLNVKVVYCLITNEHSLEGHDRIQLAELRKMSNIFVYAIKSSVFNDDLKVGGQYVRS